MHAFRRCLFHLLLLYASCVPTKNVNKNSPDCKVHIRYSLSSALIWLSLVFVECRDFFFISRLSHILFCLLRFYALPMLCCAFFIRRLMKFSKQIKNISSKRKIGSRSSAILVMVLTVMTAVMVEWNRNDLVVYGSLYWKNKCMDGEFENSVISHQHGVYTCSDFFSKVCSFYCYSDYAFVRAFSEFYLRFFFSALLNSSVDVVCYSFFVCVALCSFSFSFSLPEWTQLHAALVMHHWAWRELSIFHTAIALSNGSINILRLLFQYSHRSTEWLRAQNQSNFATKYTSWRIKNALALNQIKLLYHQIFDFVFNSDYWSSNINGNIEHAASSNIQFNWLRSNLFLYFQ